MTKTIYCTKLKANAPALEQAPFPGELGQKIVDNVSKQAWGDWLNHQTMLINEYRLSMIEPKSRQFLKDEMNAFLFNDGGTKPEGFTPVDKNDA